MTLQTQMELFVGQLEIDTQLYSADVKAAVDKLSISGIDERGAVFTRREVVDFILDLVGYTADQPLDQFRLLEPSFGSGDFLIPAIERLCQTIKGKKMKSIDHLLTTIRAVEIHKDSFDRTKNLVIKLLRDFEFSQPDAERLADRWLILGDYLLENIGHNFTHVVGNPPYIRQELIPNELILEYRKRFETIYDRADIYVPFIEKSLLQLETNGHLGFICSDRWMKNKYGSKLRRFVANNFNLKYYIDMVDTPAFHSDVIAYPAITVIKKEPASTTRFAQRPSIEKKNLASLAKTLTDNKKDDLVRDVRAVTKDSEPWILESPEQLAVVRRLESTFPSLESAACRVGIGVATGADRVFIGKFEELDVEPDRKIPVVMTRDLVNGTIKWQGLGVVNPFSESGKLVDLNDYPRLNSYFAKHAEEIRNRHVSKKNPSNWYRTIDRIYPAITKTPKLLIPDIKGDAQIVIDNGEFYPHHNLYFVTSDDWDLNALQTVLMSGIAKLFVSIYSTKMHGGFLRFQAQYLRRIRVPHWKSVRSEIKEALIAASTDINANRCNETVAEMYGLSAQERKAIGL